MRSRILLMLVLVWGGWPRGAAGEPPAPVSLAAERQFVEQVLPVLQAKCLACHGHEPDQLKGGLDLSSRAGLLAGGDSGEPGVVAGKPAESPLWLSVSRTAEDWSAMPPKENDRLSAEQLLAFKNWIEADAPWPSQDRINRLQAEIAAAGNKVAVTTTGGLSADWTNQRYAAGDVWAFRLAAPSWPPGASVDRFIDAQLQQFNLTPAPRADRRILLRRVTFDLTGLPPTAAEIDEFLADQAGEADAYAKVVERLLASPHYGERMAQHWLDVVRYADSSGFANDYERGAAWRYRDYVVRSFNTDKSYDRFVREQLAGDELDPQNPEALIATGFLRMGPWELTGMEVPKVARQRFLDDVTDSVGQVFLAQPLQCARCHDHKFDPIPTRDYYAIQAVFATLQMADRPAEYLREENRHGFAEERQYLEQRRQHYVAELAALAETEAGAKQAWEKRHPIVPGEKPPREKYLTPAHLGRERIARKELERLSWRLDRYQPVALSVYSGHTRDVKAYYAPPRLPVDPLSGEREMTAILTGGDPFSPAAVVPPGVLSAANAGSPGTIPTEVAGRRTAFADWVASPQNPLTARVMVNRLWAWHFGTPLAGNPNNFGATGKKPTHPELLDWLAAEFVKRNWSIKEMHRLIVLSQAYCRSARHPQRDDVARLDLTGTSYATFRPRRLSAEELRDAILAATGELNRTVGGVPCRPEMNPEVAFQPRQVMGTFAESWQPNPKPADRHRRSLYILRLRGLRDPFFDVFNQPVPESSCELRDTSTITPQAFTLFNAEGSYRRALTLATLVRSRSETDPLAIQHLFQRLFGRRPTEREAAACLAHWRAMTARHASLTFQKRPMARSIEREAIDENTGEKFRYTEPLEMAADFVPDLHPADCSADIRGLAEVCLVLLNSNEFITVE